ncbi:MAG: hypothetical protein ABJL67_02555 [Sulfitobacter sp.]
MEEWNTVLLAERYLLEQALAADDDPTVAEDRLPSDTCRDGATRSGADNCLTTSPATPKSAVKSRGMSQ